MKYIHVGFSSSCDSFYGIFKGSLVIGLVAELLFSQPKRVTFTDRSFTGGMDKARDKRHLFFSMLFALASSKLLYNIFTSIRLFLGPAPRSHVQQRKAPTHQKLMSTMLLVPSRWTKGVCRKTAMLIPR